MTVKLKSVHIEDLQLLQQRQASEAVRFKYNSSIVEPHLPSPFLPFSWSWARSMLRNGTLKLSSSEVSGYTISVTHRRITGVKVSRWFVFAVWTEPRAESLL